MPLELPAYLQNSSRVVATAALAGLSQGLPPYISIKQNRFRLVDAAGNERLIETFHLDVVIADANPHISKVFYKDAYDPTATDFKPPNCWSDNGEGPSDQALEPQCATCAACPQNAWGSATSKVTGKQTKACNDVKKLAALVPDLAPGMSFLLRIPPASLKNLSSYISGLNGQVTGGRRVDVTDVVTRLTFDQHVQGVLNFQAVNWINEETFKKLEEMGPNPFPRLTGVTDKPRVAALPAPSPTDTPEPGVERFSQPPMSAPAAFQPPAGSGFGNPAFQQPAAPAEPPKRTRRTKAEMDAARAAEAAQSGSGFAAPAAGPATFGGVPASPQPAPQAQFGIVQNAPAPDSGLSAAISNAFNLPM